MTCKKMKRVLYLTNIEVPYRVKFFNLMAKECELTVMYERRISSNRDAKWTYSEKKSYDVEYLDGINLGNENGFSSKILCLLRKEWDLIIVGCCNSKVQIFAMAYMRIKHISFIINLDGEPFISNGIKAKIKKMILGGAVAYLCAGDSSRKSLETAIGNEKPIRPYYFSSLTEKEVARNSNGDYKRNQTVLVIGQYFDYKGMDIAYRVACIDNSVDYLFVGMGKRTKLFISEMGNIPENIRIIPFLQKNELERLYRECAVLLLPTRQECWGLVVNEAASFGTPIVSTWGSGAAVEFLSDSYSCFLAKSGDEENLYGCLKRCLGADNTAYSEYLKEKSRYYSIEKSVEKTMELIKDVVVL